MLSFDDLCTILILDKISSTFFANSIDSINDFSDPSCAFLTINDVLSTSSFVKLASLLKSSILLAFLLITSLAFTISSTIKLVVASISRSDFCVCSANFLTSSATTAKPLPCSPALAASIAAFNARRFV